MKSKRAFQFAVASIVLTTGCVPPPKLYDDYRIPICVSEITGMNPSVKWDSVTVYNDDVHNYQSNNQSFQLSPNMNDATLKTTITMNWHDPKNLALFRQTNPNIAVVNLNETGRCRFMFFGFFASYGEWTRLSGTYVTKSLKTEEGGKNE